MVAKDNIKPGTLGLEQTEGKASLSSQGSEEEE